MNFYGMVNLGRDMILDRKLIELAMEKSPTGGNAKPFSWSWEGAKLCIRHDADLAKHYLNPHHQASWIALGCLLRSIEIAASAQGWGLNFQLREDVGADVSFVAANEVYNHQNQTQSLMKRTTYRGTFLYSGAPDSISSKIQSGTNAHIASTESLTSAFKNYIMETDTYLWLQTKATESFMKEVRFFDSRIEPRGIRSSDLGIGKMDQLMFYFLKSVPWIFSIVSRIPGLNQTFKQASKRNLQHAHFCLITAGGQTPQDLVRAGQTALTSWIELETLGYSVQPYSIASLSLVAAQNGHLPADTQEQFRKLFTQEGPDILKNQFLLEPDEKPVWMLRFGLKNS